MKTPTMVRTIHHAEHFPMEWFTLYSEESLPTSRVMESLKVAVDDDSYRGLGKFQSALDERIYDATLDGGYEECGQSEFDGHHVLVPFSVDDLVELGVIGNTQEFTHVPVGCIVTSLNSGAVDVSYYDTGAELDKAWEECLSEQSNYSQEDDDFLTFNRGSYHISLEGYGEDFDDRREAEFMLYLACHTQSYFPNCWEVNDHGNETLLFDSVEKVRDMLKGYVEFRDEQLQEAMEDAE